MQQHLRRLTVLAVSVVAMLAISAPAMAATAPGYEEFSDCPDRTVHPAMFLCVNWITDGGHVQMGTKDVPLSEPIALKGGFTAPSPLGPSQFIVGSFDGGSQEVPGGIIGATGLQWLVNLFPNNLLKLYAEPELAGNPTLPSAPNMLLPIKVKLVNPFLASTCYIGSDTTPIALALTTGTTAPPPPNTPITGANGTIGGDPGGLSIIRTTDRVLVNNSFAAPEADGCDILFPGLGIVDALINSNAGLPSPAGTNEAVFEVDIATSSVTRVFPPAGVEL
jgi:hypothetical protein